MRETLKALIKKLPIAFTQNQRYDRQTLEIIREVCHATANAVDVGCHKGEIMDIILENAPNGQHFGFEPLPDLFEGIKDKYPSNVQLFELGLSNKKGTASFNYVISNPSYSGLQKRRYDKPNEEDTTITIQINRLDDVLPKDLRVDFIKIDVEGGEYLVLQGAEQTIKQHQPVIVFEHGEGGADQYGIQPEQVYEFLVDNCGMKISTLSNWLKKKSSIDKSTFVKYFWEGTEYYWIAYC